MTPCGVSWRLFLFITLIYAIVIIKFFPIVAHSHHEHTYAYVHTVSASLITSMVFSLKHFVPLWVRRQDSMYFFFSCSFDFSFASHHEENSNSACFVLKPWKEPNLKPNLISRNVSLCLVLLALSEYELLASILIRWNYFTRNKNKPTAERFNVNTTLKLIIIFLNVFLENRKCRSFAKCMRRSGTSEHKL